MSTRPRRSSLKQKDTSVDMLGLSRQEERMLQRAMYDSLRQQSQKNLTKHHLSKNRQDSIVTRSKTLTKLLISVPETTKPNLENNLSSSTNSLPITKHHIEEQKLKRGTRYSPMRKLPLSEMLKTLEDKKNQLNNDRPYSQLSQKRSYFRAMKRHSSIVKREAILPEKQLKLLGENLVIRRPGRPKLKKEPTDLQKTGRETTKDVKPLGKSAMSSKNKRVPRNASLVARSSWNNQNSNTSSPSRSTIKTSPNIVNNSVKCKGRPVKVKQEKVIRKPKRLIYSPKVISHSQRLSRVILANATHRYKKAQIKEKNNERSSRLVSRMKSLKVNQDSKSKAMIPPELWLDPRGQPVDTEDFINFLIFRDTPYLDKSLKWFGLPPHKRKQRLYKIVPTESTKFNETIVYNEKKEGGGREIVVHCQPPKMTDDSSELILLDSDQVIASIVDDSKLKCPASVNSSCVTLAAIDDEASPNRMVNGDCVPVSVNPIEAKLKPAKIKPQSKPDSKSTHIMEIRKRKT